MLSVFVDLFFAVKTCSCVARKPGDVTAVDSGTLNMPWVLLLPGKVR